MVWTPFTRAEHARYGQRYASDMTEQEWQLNTLDASFCVEALNESIAEYGKPDIMNTDQGSQFTGAAWITTLGDAGIKIPMDGRGRYLDNIFIERLWRSLKQEAIYLHELQDGFQAERVIKNWINFYNTDRPHTAEAVWKRI